MDPLELLYSWQALLCAVACATITSNVKALKDLLYARRVLAGEVTRRSRTVQFVVDKLVMPIVPVTVGALYAIFVPVIPEVLQNHLKVHEVVGTGRILALASWGGVCGQFASYTYDRVKDIMRARAIPPSDPGESA